MAEKKEQKVETKKTQKKILKLNLKTFIIIAVTIAIAIITIVVISLVLRNNGYYLSDIFRDVNSIDRTETIENLQQYAQETNEEVYLIDLDKEILGKDIVNVCDADISFSKDGKFKTAYEDGSYSGTYKKSNNTINCTIDSFYADNYSSCNNYRRKNIF